MKTVEQTIIKYLGITLRSKISTFSSEVKRTCVFMVSDPLH